MTEDFDTDLARVQQAIDMLSEHFETTQIFVTRETEEDQKTCLSIHRGSGNWYARYGQIREWMIQQEEDARIQVHKDNP